MAKDERQSGGPEQEAGAREPQRASRPAPGKVTRTSRLSSSGGPAVQRKAAVPASGAGAPKARSAWELTMDPWMDAAHRGVTALAQSGHGAAPVQTKGLHSPPEAPPSLEGHGSGAAMPEEVRGKMESAFGVDLSPVRIHEGPHVQAVGALAYTQGTDIHFAPGQYQPTSQRGQELLGHELTHVVQQSQGHVQATTQAKGVDINDDASLEREADDMGARAARGEKIRDASHGSHGSIGMQSNGPVAQRALQSPALRALYPAGASQQAARGPLQRVPAAPTTSANAAVPFDRSKVSITEIPDIVATGPTIVPTTVGVTFAPPDINHLSWELYDPSDNMLPGSFSTTPGSTGATSKSFVIDSRMIDARSKQGRYVLRCIGHKDKVPIVYADRSFFVWTQTPPAHMDLASLNAIKAGPAKHSLGEVGAAYARSMMLEHQAAVAATGTGKYMGNQSTAPAAGATKHDCTTYVLDVLKQAFTAKGLAADWKAVYDEAQKASGGKFKGTELIDALVAKAGWKAVFWSPDPRNPSDNKAEHPTAYKEVKAKGTYYGIPVDSSKSVTDYRPTSPTKQEDMSGLDRLKSVPLAVIAARGGTHMTLLINGVVYEVHWDRPPTDANVLEATPLEKWAWLSGIVVMPP